ncbi:MAG: hypothetical protein GXP03_12685 [Alphaproteobacteria bacterium]|nr:hypothetical protein [Alphaproteobacteria bacterium]
MPNLTKTLILSDRTHRHLGRFAKGTMGGGAAPLPGGFWLVPVDDEVSARINEMRQGSESDDQVIWREMCASFFKETDQ